MADDWSRDEVELVVADYFAMLRAELSGEQVNKADHNRRLRERLGSRSKGSVEFKHANISAVLLNFGDLPYVDGYKPRSNYQALLEQVVLERLAIEPDFFARLATGPVMQPAAAPATRFDDVRRLLEGPPETTDEPGIQASSGAAAGKDRTARKVDFVRLDAENRRLGHLGEEWALEFERRRLHDVERRPDLAKRIDWVSQAEGDGAGYDLRSFNVDESRRFIEVKTTGLGKYFPFYVTPNEVVVSERHPAEYHLYRVFRFATDPRMYILPGALSSTCRLNPSQYVARAGGRS